MLDIRKLRENPEEAAKALLKKGYELDVAAFAELDAKRKTADVSSQNLQAEKKKASKKIGQLIGQGMNVDEAKEQVAKELADIDSQLDAAVTEAKAIQEEINGLLMSIPNIPDESVPEGKDEDDNVEVRVWGEPTKLAFEAKDHVDLGQA